ncbi:hypothetical protein DFH28DRAFT_1083631 [Melampsora americana]|nr:hypothetical protein DFH28DRAFT_1083631 [Melampsora americana]
MCQITSNDNCHWMLLCLQQLAHQESAQKSSRGYAKWIPLSAFSDQIRKILPLTLWDISIESYTKALDSNRIKIPGSFHQKAMHAIMNMSPAWKAENLPPDFGDTLDDLSNHMKFIHFFKDKLQHAQDNFLINCLSKLQKQVDTKAQAWFAYLITEIGIYKETSPTNCKVQGGFSHWRLIDQKLAKLCGKANFTLCTFGLDEIILDEDQDVFNGKNRCDQIKSNESFKVPTMEEVLATIPFLPANSG